MGVYYRLSRHDVPTGMATAAMLICSICGKFISGGGGGGDRATLCESCVKDIEDGSMQRLVRRAKAEGMK